MTKDEARALWNRVGDENRRKRECTFHCFEAQPSYPLGGRYPCKNCGSSFNIVEIGLYAQGYAAAGGDRNKVLNGLGE